MQNNEEVMNFALKAILKVKDEEIQSLKQEKEELLSIAEELLSKLEQNEEEMALIGRKLVEHLPSEALRQAVETQCGMTISFTCTGTKSIPWELLKTHYLNGIHSKHDDGERNHFESG